jgi:hypothetical protein
MKADKFIPSWLRLLEWAHVGLGHAALNRVKQQSRLDVKADKFIPSWLRLLEWAHVGLGHAALNRVGWTHNDSDRIQRIYFCWKAYVAESSTNNFKHFRRR